MKTTTLKMKKYLREYMDYSHDEIEETMDEWGNDIEGFLKNCGGVDKNELKNLLTRL